MFRVMNYELGKHRKKITESVGVIVLRLLGIRISVYFRYAVFPILSEKVEIPSRLIDG